MPRKLNQAAQAALSRVEVCKSRIHALCYAVDGLRDDYDFKPAEADFSRLYSLLYRKLNDAYRDVFMWGIVNKESQREAERAAFGHYLRQGHAIMGYLSLDGSHPSRWSGEEQDEFSAEIEAARLASEAASRDPSPSHPASDTSVGEDRPAPRHTKSAVSVSESGVPGGRRTGGESAP